MTKRKDLKSLLVEFKNLSEIERDEKRKEALSKKVKKICKWICDVSGRKRLYFFHVYKHDFDPAPTYDVWYDRKNDRIVKSEYEECRLGEVVGTYYITYYRIGEVVDRLIEVLENDIKEIKKHLRDEYKINKLLNCIESLEKLP